MENINIKLTAPDGYEFDRFDEETKTVIWKPVKKELTYEYICEKLFKGKHLCFANAWINNNATSEHQLKKMLAYNKLMNIAEYLNDGWKPNWKDTHEDKYYIMYNYEDSLYDISVCMDIASTDVCFKSEELAKQAIKIMGDDLDVLFK